MTEIPEPALLVVGGAMRGGTSLLQDVLDSHPQVHLMAMETRALRYADFATWAHAAAVHQSSMSTIRRTIDRRYRGQVRRYLWNIVRGHAAGELTTVDRIHHAFVAALGAPGCAYVGDKYPDYVLQYPQFVHRPNTKCVFVYRDARDVVASIHHRIHRGDWRGRTWVRKYNTIEKATDYWLAIMQAFHDLRQLETNAFLIRYEDLVLESAATVAAIALHLELPADGFDATLPNASSIGRYRERLSAQQLQVIEHRAGSVMEHWGYQPNLRS